MRKALIFSDVHLKAAASDRTRQRDLVRFLYEVDPTECERVICVGDLFDFWFEYRHVIFSGYFDVLRAFASLRDSRVALHLVCGNHDFWAGRFLEEELGFQVHKNAVDLPFGDRNVRFVHGDGIDPKDHGYHIYKRIARNPFVMWAFRQLHPDWAMGLANFVSKTSRTRNEHRDPAQSRGAKALHAYAKRTLAAGEVDAVVCGHSHAPEMEEYPMPEGKGLYINCGDWVKNRSYVVWDGAEFHLHAHRPPG